jgi:DNA-binding transcriptional regulator LsrR (DeoR family)
MANQFSISEEKRTDIIWLYFFEHWTMKDLTLKYRLDRKSIKRILEKSLEFKK